MQPLTFDHLTRLFHTSRSRRSIAGVVLGLILSRGTTLASGKSRQGGLGKTCDDGNPCRGDACCGGRCCPGHCFVNGANDEEFCCIKPDFDVCLNRFAANRQERHICCPVDKDVPCGCAVGGIAGSYRRPR